MQTLLQIIVNINQSMLLNYYICSLMKIHITVIAKTQLSEE